MADVLAVGGLEFHMEQRATGGDGGPTLRVMGTVDSKPVQIFRFDMFRVQPHYHYDPSGTDLRYNLDPLTIDDGIAWVISLLGRKLPQMLAKAGCAGAVSEDGLEAVTRALPEIERRWRAAAEPQPAVG
jgi:hypothetical protein